METIINDGAYSVLSIFPIARTIEDDAQYDKAFDQALSSILKKNPFLKRVGPCASGCTGTKNESFRCSCFDAVDSFLGGDNVGEERGKRVYLGTTYAQWQEKPLRMDIFLKIISKKNVGIVNFNFVLDGFNVQEAIALRHISGADCFDQQRSCLSCFSSSAEAAAPLEVGAMSTLFYGIINDLKEGMPNSARLKGSGDVLVNEIVSFNPKYKLQTIIELRSIDDLVNWEQNTHLWAENHAQMIYGLITGDEGIGYIPDEFAKERISEHWASRDFFDTIAIKNNVMLINSKATGTLGKKYMDYQREWNQRFNGGESRIQYFTGKPCIAGFDHGILNAVERNMVILFYYDFIDHQEKRTEKQLNKQRQKLLSFISSSMSSIDEINELYETISRASKTDLSISRVRNRLDIQSEEMNIDYQYKNNDVIYVLTVLSLTIAVFAIQKSDNLFVGINPFWRVLLIIGTLVGCIFLSVVSTAALRWLRSRFSK